MRELIFAIEAVFPIILLVALGYFLKRLGILTKDIAGALNKIVFRVFLPAMLFLNVYGIENMSEISFGYIGYGLSIVVLVFIVLIPLSRIATKEDTERGVVLQCGFRSNYALIGIPLATAFVGDAAGASSALLAAFAIPVFNTLAVISLSIFVSREGERADIKGKILNVLFAILKNPLVLAVLSGFVVLGIRAIFDASDISFRLTDIVPLYKALVYLKSCATPVALLALGAQFEFGDILGYKRQIVFSVFVRNIFVTALGMGGAILLFRDIFTSAEFAALFALFVTPVAVSSVPMAQEMKNDVKLAGQLVVFTTLVSAITIFIGTFLLKLIGIF